MSARRPATMRSEAPGARHVAPAAWPTTMGSLIVTEAPAPDVASEHGKDVPVMEAVAASPRGRKRVGAMVALTVAAAIAILVAWFAQGGF